MKTGGKEMENQQEAMSMMMMMFERMLQEQREMSEITTVVQQLVQRNGQFEGKDVSHYLRDYKAEMLRYGISERLQVISFNRVATDELQESLHKIRQQNPTWESFEEAIRDAYDYLRPKRPRTWSMNGGQQWVRSDDRLPPTEESLMRKGSEMHDKSQVDIEGELKTEPKSRPTKDEEEEDRGRKGIPTPVLDTSAVVPVHQRETGETGCIGEKVEDRKGDEEDKVNEHERRDSFTPIPEISTVEPVCRHKTEDKGDGGNEMKVEADAFEGEIAEEVAMGKTTEDGNTEDSCPLILETSAVVFENQRETGETGGGDKKGKVGSRFGWKVIRTGFRSERKPNRVKEDSTESRPERKPNRAKEDSAERRPKRKPNRAKEDSAERRPERKPNRAETESAERRLERKPNRVEPESVERRSVEPKLDKSRSNRKPIGRDRFGKKLIRLNRTLDRSRPVNTRKRKPTETETDRSKPARKEANSIETDQPIPIRPNTNPIGNQSNRKPIRRDRSGKRSRLMKTRKTPSRDTTTEDKGQEYGEKEQRIWWIGWRQWFGWKEWTFSKWRDKVDIAGETEAEGEITSTDNFSRYQRLCGFGGGECCSVIRTLREKC